MKKADNVKYAVSGALAGLANGFFGAGGGMFLVPLLCRWAKVEDRYAFPTTLAVIMPLSVISAVVYFMNNSLDIMRALPYLAGGLAGGIIGGWVFKKIPVVWLRRALALFIIYGGVRSLFGI